MGSHDRDYFRDEERRRSAWGDSDLGPCVRWLLISLGACALLVTASPVVGAWIGLSPTFLAEWFGFSPAKAVGDFQLWRFATYGHLTGISFSLIVEMFMLYFFGKEVEKELGATRFLVLYFGGALFGALAFSVFHFASAAFGGMAIAGPRVSVWAVIMWFTFRRPRRRILLMLIIPMEMWLCSAIIFAIDVASYAGGASSVIAGIGGAIFGGLYYRFEGPVLRYLNGLDRKAEAKKVQKVINLELHVDELLDKINREGITALTEREKSFLKNASKHYGNKAG